MDTEKLERSIIVAMEDAYTFLEVRIGKNQPVCFISKKYYEQSIINEVINKINKTAIYKAAIVGALIKVELVVELEFEKHCENVAKDLFG